MAEIAQSVAFLEYFSGLADPRQAGKILYPLDEIMLLVLCGEVAGAEGFPDIALWGGLHVDFLRRFLPFERGIPSHDALNDLFNALDGHPTSSKPSSPQRIRGFRDCSSDSPARLRVRWERVTA